MFGLDREPFTMIRICYLDDMVFIYSLAVSHCDKQQEEQ